MTAVTAPLLPADRPRYVMGVGILSELPQYVSHGIDMMDCVLPSRNARNGYLFTSQGKVVIKHARYIDDGTALDPACGCYTCRTFSKAYLRHLFQAGEILFSTLATLHNIHYFLDIMRRMREAILLGRFPHFLRSAANLNSELGQLTYRPATCKCATTETSWPSFFLLFQLPACPAAPSVLSLLRDCPSSS